MPFIFYLKHLLPFFNADALSPCSGACLIIGFITGEIAFDDITYLAVPRTKSVTFKQRSLVVSGPRLWNSLPTVIKMENSMVGFKRKIKTHLFKLAFNI